jgi:hypothetical protein
MTTPDVIDLAAAALDEKGLILRGGFVFGADEPAPSGPSGHPARSVMLVGQGGGTLWPAFLRWQKTQPPDLSNPLDTWSRLVIGEVARKVGARAVSPSDRPFLPFQQWAMRAEALKASPLGILMHPKFGLWHAYRGALLFDVEFSIQEAEKSIHLCDLCDGKPCLNACPAGAFSDAGFAHADCLAHVRGPDGARCRATGCIARNACPYGTAYRYPPEAQAFHMASFAGVVRDNSDCS